MDNTTPIAEFPRLLPVTAGDIGGRSEMLVDSRQLHAALGVETRYNDWIVRRLKDHPCLEGVDYAAMEFYSNLSKTSDRGGRPPTTYALTLRLAKLIAMSEHTPAGDRVRDYFLECERRAIGVQADISEDAFLRRLGDSSFLLKLVERKTRELVAAEKQIVAMETQMLRDAPKIAYADAVKAADADWLPSEVAKALSPALRMGYRAILKRMRDDQILFRHNKRLVPYQGMVDAGLCRLADAVANPQAVFTPSGRRWLLRKFAVVRPTAQPTLPGILGSAQRRSSNHASMLYESSQRRSVA